MSAPRRNSAAAAASSNSRGTASKQLVDQGKTLQEVLEAKPTADYDAATPGGTTPLPGGGTSADRFVGTIYAELKSASAAAQ